MPSLQDWIHKLEEGGGARHLKTAAFCVAVLVLMLVYNWCAYRNFATPEAMDAAQLARNLSEGKGYTTLFIRPFSLYLVQRHNQAKAADALASVGTDFAHVKTAHPDLANPPVYPLVLAGLMKVLPFHYPLDLKSAFWSSGGNFWRYEPDFLIALFNQVLLLVVVVLTFFLARKLFDANVAWLSAILMLGCELLWRFSVSGLSTMLLLVIFFGLTWCILRIEEVAREPQASLGRLLGLAIAAGLLTGAGALTRYAFGWMIIPVIVFLILFGGPRRALCVLAALGAFALVLAPWIIRNFTVSGTPFGTAGFAVVEGTATFPGFQLERSINPHLSDALGLATLSAQISGQHAHHPAGQPAQTGRQLGEHVVSGGSAVEFPQRGRAADALFFPDVSVDLHRRAGDGANAAFRGIAGGEFRKSAGAVRAAGVHLRRQFVSHPAGSDEAAASRIALVVKVVFVGLCCAPMIFTLLPPRTRPVAYPPYYPPDIQPIAGWMRQNELMMSDVPWAVAWYGQRQCVWLTLNSQDDFFAINDYLKPVQALYLTPETMAAAFGPDWVRPDQHSWGNFILQTVAQNRIPANFPLDRTPPGFFPERLFLTDSDRWKLQK